MVNISKNLKNQAWSEAGRRGRETRQGARGREKKEGEEAGRRGREGSLSRRSLPARVTWLLKLRSQTEMAPGGSRPTGPKLAKCSGYWCNQVLANIFLSTAYSADPLINLSEAITYKKAA